jgi:hypothetical protein
MPPTRQSKYQDIRPLIKPGDCAAFIGRTGFFSWAIRTFSGRPTHVAPVAWIESDSAPRVVLVEALEGKGVVWSYLSERIEGYDGEVYIMRLDPTLRFDSAKSAEYLKNMIGTPYSMFGALFSAVGQWFKWGGKSLLNAVFCSKLAWWALYRGGILSIFLGRDQTPTPNQLKRLPVWFEFVQVGGDSNDL